MEVSGAQTNVGNYRLDLCIQKLIFALGSWLLSTPGSLLCRMRGERRSSIWATSSVLCHCSPPWLLTSVCLSVLQRKALPLPCPLASFSHSSHSSGEKKLLRPQQEEDATQKGEGICSGMHRKHGEIYIKAGFVQTFDSDSLINLNHSFTTPGAGGRSSCTRWEAVTDKEGSFLPENYNLGEKKEGNSPMTPTAFQSLPKPLQTP